MKKKLAILLLFPVLIVLASCFEETYFAEDNNRNTINISATNLHGDDAIPVAYDAYNQMQALLSPQSGQGFDVDIYQTMVLNVYEDATPFGHFILTAEGNKLMNVNGNRVQTVVVADMTFSYEDKFDHSSHDEIAIEIHREMYDENVTSFRAIIDGNEIMESDIRFYEPILSIYLDSLQWHKLLIPMDSIMYAEVVNVDGNTHVNMSIDPHISGVSYLIKSVFNELFGDPSGYFSLSAVLSAKPLNYLFIVDNAGNLLYSRINISMELRDTWSSIEHLYEITFTSSQTFNNIGNMHIEMPHTLEDEPEYDYITYTSPSEYITEYGYVIEISPDFTTDSQTYYHLGNVQIEVPQLPETESITITVPDLTTETEYITTEMHITTPQAFTNIE